MQVFFVEPQVIGATPQVMGATPQVIGAHPQVNQQNAQVTSDLVCKERRCEVWMVYNATEICTTSYYIVRKTKHGWIISSRAFCFKSFQQGFKLAEKPEEPQKPREPQLFSPI